MFYHSADEGDNVCSLKIENKACLFSLLHIHLLVIIISKCLQEKIATGMVIMAAPNLQNCDQSWFPEFGFAVFVCLPRATAPRNTLPRQIGMSGSSPGVCLIILFTS